MDYHRAVVLLSGGIDSTTALAIANLEVEDVFVLSFRYGQRHDIELEHAEAVIRHYQELGVIGPSRSFIQTFDLRLWGGSALTGKLEVPKDRPLSEMAQGIPPTYVPARNTVFLAFALALAEAVGAEAVYGGWNALDYSGYPDCRPEYLAAMQRVFELGTRHVDGATRIELIAPLVHLTKAQIIREGIARKAPYHLTWSCYDPQNGHPCGRCDSCLLRAKGFDESGIFDPAQAQAGVK
jgi:7-cyano-7-deazaguanine synthase